MEEKIGQYFVRLSLLSFEQAEEVLKIQELNPNKRFGEIALELDYITKDDLQEYIEDSEKDLVN
ncbi:MAG: hypothetical protein JXR64_07380 [Spirochaetales bacterium]|nr:hypothetical protein [Spirochaetales bacterium]